ncbi:MAG: hypothetical protein HFF98_07410 [Oscillibacter sp.]|jgi:hypothetical protein|nr:hypothetical protein [Oscillibacter sp.]
MRRYLPLLGVLFLLLLTACGPAEGEESPEPPEEGPLALASLSVEVSRGTLSTEELARAVRELPEALRAALADQGVEAETVSVSVGSSPEATAQAVREGGVDAAFLPAEDYAALENPPRLLLTAGDGEGAMAAMVHPEDTALAGERFAKALAAAVNAVREEQPVFGPRDYAWAEPEEDAAGEGLSP